MSAEGYPWDLEPLLRPGSVAIVGCSQDLSRLGGRPLRFLLEREYPGKIFPVNPKYSEIAGLRCFESVAAIPDAVDVALVLVPAAAVGNVLEECGKAGVRSAIVFSSGFAEMGAEGRDAQDRLSEISRRFRMPVLGPNCLGVINLVDGIPLSFASVLDMGNLRSGGLAFVSQSGALATFVMGAAQEASVGFSHWVTTGNEASLEASAVVRHLLLDEKVTGVLLYLEEARDPEGLMEAGRLARERGKPIICLKVGRSSSGRRAASSHTGALAGSDEAYDAAFKAAGITRAADVEELLDLGIAFTDGWVPAGRNVAILTMSGGGGIILADSCEELGLRVPELSSRTRDSLRKVVPAFGATANPVDVTAELVASPGLLKKSLDIVLSDPGVDSAVIFLGIQRKTALSLSRDISEAVGLSRREGGKPILVAWMAPPKEAVAALRDSGVPLFFDGVRAVKALARLTSEGGRRTGGDRPSALDSAIEVLARVVPAHRADPRESGRLALKESACKAFLQELGLTVPRGRTARSEEEAVFAAEEIGYPVVMKVDSPDILHKSDANAVVVGVKPSEVRRAFRDILENSRRYRGDARIEGVLVEEMVSGALEAIIGARWDDRFGAMVMIGLGGVFVEVMKDFCLRLAPVDEEEALEMLASLKASKLFSGYRGAPPRDAQATAKAVSTISRIAAGLGERLLELDVNPLFVMEQGKGVKVGDALMVLKEGL